MPEENEGKRWVHAPGLVKGSRVVTGQIHGVYLGEGESVTWSTNSDGIATGYTIGVAPGTIRISTKKKENTDETL